MSADTFKRIRTLILDAVDLENFNKEYEETKKKPGCDKYGFGFGEDNRFSSFQLKNLNFASWKGYFGNSSCSTILHIRDPDTVAKYITKAINLHQQEIFKTAARLMKEQAACSRETAEKEIQSMLDELKNLDGIDEKSSETVID